MANILIVDDDPSIVEVVNFVLTKDGHTVSIARDGKSGLNMARTKKPDLIVLDVMMPEMDGFSVSGELFKDAALRQVPVIILTAKGNMRDIFSLVPNIGMYMNKPFEVEELRKNIRTLLDRQSKAA